MDIKRKDQLRIIIQYKLLQLNFSKKVIEIPISIVDKESSCFVKSLAKSKDLSFVVFISDI